MKKARRGLVKRLKGEGKSSATTSSASSSSNQQSPRQQQRQRRLQKPPPLASTLEVHFDEENIDAVSTNTIVNVKKTKKKRKTNDQEHYFNDYTQNNNNNRDYQDDDSDNSSLPTHETPVQIGYHPYIHQQQQQQQQQMLATTIPPYPNPHHHPQQQQPYPYATQLPPHQPQPVVIPPHNNTGNMMAPPPMYHHPSIQQQQPPSSSVVYGYPPPVQQAPSMDPYNPTTTTTTTTTLPPPPPNVSSPITSDRRKTPSPLALVEYPAMVSPEAATGQAATTTPRATSPMNQQHRQRRPGRFGESPLTLEGFPSIAATESPEEIRLLRDRLRDAHRVVKAVLGVESGTESASGADHSTTTDAIRAIRRFAAIQQELATTKELLYKNQRDRRELERQWTEVCLERNQQTMRVASLEQSLLQQQRRTKRLTNENQRLLLTSSSQQGVDNNNKSVSSSLVVSSTALTPYKNYQVGGGPTTEYEKEMELQIVGLQQLLEQRQGELSDLQEELASARQRESMVPEELVERCQDLEKQYSKAQEEIRELEQERQDNMRDIVDLSKQLREKNTMSSTTVLALSSKQELEKSHQEQKLLVEDLRRQLEGSRKEIYDLQRKHRMEEEQSNGQRQHLNELVKLQQEQMEGWHRQHREELETVQRALREEQNLRRSQWENQSTKLRLEWESAEHERLGVLQQSHQEHLQRLQTKLRQTQKRLDEFENNVGAETPSNNNSSNGSGGVVVVNSAMAMSKAMEEQAQEIKVQQETMQSLCENLERTTQERNEYKEELAQLLKQHREEDLPKDVLDLRMQLSESHATVRHLKQELLASKTMSLEQSDEDDGNQKRLSSFASKDTELVNGDTDGKAAHPHNDENQRKYEARIEDLETELLERDSRIEALEKEVSASRRRASATQATQGSQEQQSESKLEEDEHDDADGDFVNPSYVQQQLLEAREALERKEEEYGSKLEQVVDLRKKLEETQTLVQDLELERNYNLAKVAELNRLLLSPSPTDAQKALHSKALECAALMAELDRARETVERLEKENERLSQEREVSHAKVAELSGIWDNLPTIVTAKQELERSVERAAAMLDSSQEEARQLAKEREIAINKASKLAVGLAESKETVEELRERLEHEIRENERKERLMQQQQQDGNAVMVMGDVEFCNTDLDDGVSSASSSMHGMKPKSRRFFRKFKLSRKTSEVADNSRMSELEETIVKQQLQIAKLHLLESSNKKDSEPGATTSSHDEDLPEQQQPELDGDKAAGVLQDGDEDNGVAEVVPKASLSLEEAQELTIHRLMQKIESLEEDKSDQAHSIESLRRTLEIVQHENVAKSIRMEAMENTTTTSSTAPTTATEVDKEGVLSPLKTASLSYDDSMNALRSELNMLRQSMEENVMASQSNMKQLAQDNAALSVKISSLTTTTTAETTSTTEADAAPNLEPTEASTAGGGGAAAGEGA